MGLRQLSQATMTGGKMTALEGTIEKDVMVTTTKMTAKMKRMKVQMEDPTSLKI